MDLFFVIKQIKDYRLFTAGKKTTKKNYIIYVSLF